MTNKAIATAPGEPTKYKPLLNIEKKRRAEEEKEYAKQQPMRDWEGSMRQSDNIMSRDIEEIIASFTPTQMNRLPQEMIDRFDAKKALRSQKPVIGE